jgi:hypothetical protein
LHRRDRLLGVAGSTDREFDVEITSACGTTRVASFSARTPAAAALLAFSYATGCWPEVVEVLPDESDLTAVAISGGGKTVTLGVREALADAANPGTDASH